MKRAACALALLFIWQASHGGAFIFAIDNDQMTGTQRTLTHSTGYTGAGGMLTVTVCIANDSESKALLRDPVLNAIDRFNQGVPVTGNLRVGDANDIPFNAIDVESTIFHELGHCQGLAHPNMASESGSVGVSSTDWNYTKSTPDGNGQFDFGAGLDGLRGSPDDQRADDVNFHWFEVGVNNPFRIPLRADIDPASYSLDLVDLPAGDSYAANGDRDVSAGTFGLAPTEAVMQQGQGFDEDQRALTADDVATLAIARAGFDRTAGTSDDYTVELVYGGDDGTGDCDIDVNMSGSSFAFCRVTGQRIGDDQLRITSALAQFASTSEVNWYFSDDRIPAPGRDSLTVMPGGTVTELDSGQNSLLANDSQPEGKAMTLDPDNYGGPDHGTVTLNADGTFSYTHDDDGSAEDFFIYRVCVDGTETCSYQQVDVTVQTIPTAGIAVVAGATPSSIDEPGGSVMIDVEVLNNSSLAGTLNVDTLTDNVIGSLDGQGTCTLPQTLAQGQGYACSYTASVSGNGGDDATRTITAAGTHDAGGPVSDEDDAAITVSDVPPAGSLTNVPDPATLDEPGGTVTWTLTVANSSTAESLELSTLVDDRNGNLAGRGSCTLPQTIATGDSYTCSYQADLLAQPGAAVNTTAAVLGDDDGGSTQLESTASITVADLDPALALTLTAAPAVVDASGGTVTFTVSVDNTSPGDDVTLTALADDVLGALDGRGDCSLPAPIARGATYTCSYTDTLSGPAGTQAARTVTGTAQDEEANSTQADDTATVQFETTRISVVAGASPTSVAEPGGDVTINVEVQNDSTLAGTLTVDALTDNVIGSLDGQGTCTLPQTLAQGQGYACSYTAAISGNGGDDATRTITAAGTHDAGGPVSDEDDAAITVSDVPPAGSLTNVPDPATLDEPGGTVTWTLTVANSSTAESLELSTLVDDRNGNLAGRGSCTLPQTIATGDSYTCSYQADLLAQPGAAVNTTAAVLGDDDGGSTQLDSTASITVADLDPALALTLTAAPAVVDASGGTVTFTVSVDNTSPGDDVTLTALADDVLGALDGRGDCSLPAPIARGATYTCSYTDTLSGPAGTQAARTVTGTGQDEEANSTQAGDTAMVQFEDDTPQATLTRTLVSTSPDEPGGELTFSLSLESLESGRILNLSALTDTLDGDLDGRGSCAVPQTISPGGHYDCSYTVTVTDATAALPRASSTEARLSADGVNVSILAGATVTFGDVLPDAGADLAASPADPVAPQAEVIYSVAVRNNGNAEPLLLTDLDDDVLGELDGQGTCLLPVAIAPGATYECMYATTVSGQPNQTVTRRLTATLTDDEGNSTAPDDTAAVTFRTGINDTIFADGFEATAAR